MCTELLVSCMYVSKTVIIEYIGLSILAYIANFVFFDTASQAYTSRLML